MNEYDSLAARVIAFLSPHTQRTFPGRRAGVLATLGRALTWSAVRHWASGRRPLPGWVARVWADVIESRSRAGLALADDLRRHARDMDEKSRRLTGCCAPPEVPGRIC